MAGPVVRRSPLPALLGEALDWLVLTAGCALLAWAALTGLTFMPAAGFVQNRPLLVTFELGSLLIGASALLRWFLGGRALPSPVLWTVGALAALCLLSLAHTVDLYATREEVFFVLAASVLTLAVTISLRDAHKASACVAGLALIAAGEAALGLGQWASGAPTPAYWLSRAFAGLIPIRIYGTLGSPNVLAGFLLLGIAAGVLLLVSLPGLWRVLPAPLVCVEVVALLLTFSRGGYLGLAAFVLAGGVFLWPLRRRAWPVLALIVVLAGIVTARLPTIAVRAQSIAPAPEDTGTSRLFIWRTALRMWTAHRLWGTGLGTFNAAYSSFRPPGVLTTYAMLAIPGSAHDDYLQLLVETGMAGTTLLGAAVVWGLWRAGRRFSRGTTDDRAWLGAWAAGLVGIGVASIADENLFVLTNSTLLCLLSAAAASRVTAGRPPLRVGQRLLALPLIAVLGGLPPLLGPPVRATLLHGRARGEVAAGRYVDAVRTFQSALAADPLNAVVPAYFADLLADLYLRKIDTPAGPWPTLRDRAAGLYERAARLAPHDAYPWAELGHLRRFEGRYGEEVEALRQAVACDPYTPRYRVWLGEALAASGDPHEAAAQLREAARLYPVELLVIAHHEGRGAHYEATLAELAATRRLLGRLEGRPP
jgi:putative inorganic carbon (hco3(-)) transporter